MLKQKIEVNALHLRPKEAEYMIRKWVQNSLDALGYEIRRKSKSNDVPSDFEEEHIKTLHLVKDKTMTSPQRIFSLIEAIKYIEVNKLEGAIVECGVWKGGSMMTAAITLSNLGNNKRHLFLYDTFEGMSDPTDSDISVGGQSARDLLKANEDRDQNPVWAYSALEEVTNNLSSTGYPAQNIHYIQGKVEETIPKTIPDKIAILRLDTDWYESTRHELEHLFPLLVDNGVLIIDDYGHWAGARKAVDEYFRNLKIIPYLSRIDETGRIVIKNNHASR